MPLKYRDLYNFPMKISHACHALNKKIRLTACAARRIDLNLMEGPESGAMLLRPGYLLHTQDFYFYTLVFLAAFRVDVRKDRHRPAKTFVLYAAGGDAFGDEPIGDGLGAFG